MFDTTWDAVIVGSGVGGLVTAALLAKRSGRKVLVLEAHNRLGGFTHTFERQGRYRFDVGVHYVGGVSEGSELRQLFDYVSDSRLRWRPLPSDLDHLYFEDEDFIIPSNGRDFRLALQHRFHDERAAIETYFSDLREIANAYLLWQMAENFPLALRHFERWRIRHRYPDLFATTETVLARRFQNARLREILTAQWGGFGVKPDKSSFGFHALHSTHYMNGAWFPEGGSDQIARTIVREIEKAGGCVMSRAPVEKILTRGGRVRGVRVQGQELECSLVISNAGAKATYLQLLDVPAPFQESLRQQPPGPSALVAYLGLKDSPASLGLNAANHWVFDESPLYLSFPSLKQDAKAHTAELMMPFASTGVAAWAESGWKRRPEEYSSFKQNWLEHALARIERRFSGFEALVEYSEVSTPLTVTHFMRPPDGAIFGLPATPERLAAPWARSQTPIKGLYLTGSDVLSSGVTGAALGGLKTYNAICERPGFKNSLHIRRQLRQYNGDVVF